MRKNTRKGQRKVSRWTRSGLVVAVAFSLAAMPAYAKASKDMDDESHISEEKEIEETATESNAEPEPETEPTATESDASSDGDLIDDVNPVSTPSDASGDDEKEAAKEEVTTEEAVEEEVVEESTSTTTTTTKRHRSSGGSGSSSSSSSSVTTAEVATPTVELYPIESTDNTQGLIDAAYSPDGIDGIGYDGTNRKPPAGGNGLPITGESTTPAWYAFFGSLAGLVAMLPKRKKVNHD